MFCRKSVSLYLVGLLGLPVCEENLCDLTMLTVTLSFTKNEFTLLCTSSGSTLVLHNVKPKAAFRSADTCHVNSLRRSLLRCRKQQKLERCRGRYHTRIPRSRGGTKRRLQHLNVLYPRPIFRTLHSPLFDFSDSSFSEKCLPPSVSTEGRRVGSGFVGESYIQPLSRRHDASKRIGTDSMSFWSFVSTITRSA